MASPRRRSLWSRALYALSFAGLASAPGALGLATGCGAAGPAPAASIKPCDVQLVSLHIYAADNINPNEDNRPRPVVVRLYQLKNEMRMENASYDEILLRDKETLQDDLMKVDEVQVFPNDLVEVKFERIKEAGSLAGVALFHGPKGSSWKTFYAFPLPPGETQCGGRSIDAGKPEADPRMAFFVESTRIDNGAQLDETMFPDASAVRQVSLSKRAATAEAPLDIRRGTAPDVPTTPQAPMAPQAPTAPQVPAAPPALPR